MKLELEPKCTSLPSPHSIHSTQLCPPSSRHFIAVNYIDILEQIILFLATVALFIPFLAWTARLHVCTHSFLRFCSLCWFFKTWFRYDPCQQTSMNSWLWRAPVALYISVISLSMSYCVWPVIRANMWVPWGQGPCLRVVHVGSANFLQIWMEPSR